MQSAAGGGQISLVSRTGSTERSAKLTAVLLIGAVHTVPLEVTPAVQVNTLPTGTGELFGRAGAGDLRRGRWSAGSWEHRAQWANGLHQGVIAADTYRSALRLTHPNSPACHRRPVWRPRSPRTSTQTGRLHKALSEDRHRGGLPHAEQLKPTNIRDKPTGKELWIQTTQKGVVHLWWCGEPVLQKATLSGAAQGDP